MNWNEFFHMGGYAMYVWPSFGLAFVVLVANVAWAVKRKRYILDDLKRKVIAGREYNS
ncbi:MAG: Heme exporter protein D [Gammaproteobacteria bacterium]|nr:Heme exporter protein D [Gammaproteobacteria bacterium]